LMVNGFLFTNNLLAVVLFSVTPYVAWFTFTNIHSAAVFEKDLCHCSKGERESQIHNHSGNFSLK